MDKNKRKILIASIVVVLGLILAGIAFAATVVTSSDRNYVIDVKDNGEHTTSTSEDGNVQVQTKIIDAQDTELTLETTVKNAIESKEKEVAIVLDTSYSLDTNAKSAQIKTIGKNLVEEMCREVTVKDISIALVDNDSVRVGRQRLEAASEFTYTNSIDNITIQSYNNIINGLELAKGTFSSNSVEKIVIVITDSTDNAQAVLEDMGNNNIKIYSILTDITSTAFGTETTPNPESATVYMQGKFLGEGEEGTRLLVEDINKMVHEINLTNEFDASVLYGKTRGNFTFEKISDEITQDDDGLIHWNIGNLKAQESKTITYKVKLKNNQSIGRDSLYYDIKMIKDMTINYIPYKQTDKTDLKVVKANPTIQICDAYELKIKAVGKETKVPVEGVKFKITGVDTSTGALIIDKENVVTDANGYINEKVLVKPQGKIRYTITPTVENLVGYSQTQNMYVEIENRYDAEGKGLEIKSTPEYEGQFTVIDISGKRTATVEVPIELQKFKFIVDVEDLTNNSIKLSGGEFELIQPKYNNRSELNQAVATSINGKVTFEAVAMTHSGTYEYRLTQSKDIDSYNNMSYALIRVTFDDNGNVVQTKNLEILHNNNVSQVYLDEKTVEVKLGLESNAVDKFEVELNVKDEFTNEPIRDVYYDLYVGISSDKNAANTHISRQVTNHEGKLVFTDIPVSNIAEGTKASLLNVWVVEQVDANSGYINDLNAKEFQIKIVDGIIEGINPIEPSSLDVKKDKNLQNRAVVNLQKTPKQEVNQIKIHVVDSTSSNLSIPNIRMKVRDITDTSNIMTFPDQTTSVDDGIAIFTLPTPMTTGEHIFGIQADIPSSSTTYNPAVGEELIKVTVGENGKIDVNTPIEIPTTSTVPEDSRLIAKVEAKLENTSTIKYYSANVEYKLYAKNPVYFTINLTDYPVDGKKSKGIENAEYEISANRYDSAGNLLPGGNIYSKIKTKTDASGNITGYSKDGILIPGMLAGDGNIVEITVKQTNTMSIGYKADTREYTIKIYIAANGEIIANVQVSNPSGDAVPSDVGVEVDQSTGIVKFNHKNEGIAPKDIRLDLNISKIDAYAIAPGTVDGIKLRVVSKDFKKNGSDLDITLETGAQGNPGSIFIQDLEPKLPDKPEANETKTCEITVYECVYSDGKQIDETRCKFQIQYRYDVNRGLFVPDVINASTDTNTNMYIQRESRFTNSEETSTCRRDVGVVKLYTYDSLVPKANITLDFKKLGYDEDFSKRPELNGAKYDIEIESPEKSRVSSIITIDNNNPELNAVIKEGSIITLTEREDGVPAGYERNDKTETITVTNLDEATGTLEMEAKSSYDPSRIELKSARLNPSGIGWIQEINLIDSEANTFEFGITSIDADTNTAVAGNSYKITTQTGNNKVTPLTDLDGQTSTKIGGTKQNDWIEYTINQNIADNTDVAQYYKRLGGNIVARVYFGPNEEPDLATTVDQINQTDPNYGITWEFDGSSSNGISIKIKQQKQEKLKVNVTVKDKITNANIEGLGFYVTPDVELMPDGAKGISGRQIAEVSYVQNNVVCKYNIHFDSGIPAELMPINYMGIPDQEFEVTYDTEGKIVAVAPPSGSSYFVSITQNGNFQVDIVLCMEPAVPFVFTNVAYDFTKADGMGGKLQGGAFEITRNDGLVGKPATTTTGSDGNQIHYTGELGQPTNVFTYTVKQTQVANNQYAKVADFSITVEYGPNREIVNAYVTTPDLSTNKLVVVTHKTPSELGDIGYNNNDKGIVYITVKNYPSFRINITNVDRKEGTPIAQTRYNVNSNIPTSGASITGTNSADGTETIYLDRTIFSGTSQYTITETDPGVDLSNPALPVYYQALSESLKMNVKFDENGYVNIADTNPVELVQTVQSQQYVDPAQQYWITPVNDAVNPVDHFTINVTIKSVPKVRMNITNINGDKASTVQLAGSVFNITPTQGLESSAPVSTQVTTNSGAPVQGTIDGITPVSASKKYTITNPTAATGYQTIGTPLELEIEFDSDGYAAAVNIAPNSNTAIYMNGTIYEPRVISADYFTINLRIISYPLITVNIRNIDRSEELNGNIVPLTGAQYQITPTIGSGTVASNPTVQDGTTKLDVDTYSTTSKTLSPNTQIFKITNTKASSDNGGYQTIEDSEIKIEYDTEGKVVNAIAQGICSNYITVDRVYCPSSTYTQNFVIDITIKSNPLIKIGINKLSRTTRAELAGVRFSVKATVERTGDILYNNEDASCITDANGNYIFNIDRSLDNETILYTIREVKNITGFEYIDSRNHEFVMKVKFDNNGKIREQEIELITYNEDGTSKAHVTDSKNIDGIIEIKRTSEFGIELDIINKEIEQFGIELQTVDAYDFNKKVDATVNAHLVKNNFEIGTNGRKEINNDYVDIQYQTTLQTGADRDADGVPDLGHGRDYQTLGQYTEDTYTNDKNKRTRYLRLEDVVIPDKYYKGSDVQPSVYKETEYPMYIKIEFTDEGKVKSVGLRGHTDEPRCMKFATKINYSDSRKGYLDVSIDPVNPYKINIILKYYPKFEVTIDSVDQYTGDLLEGDLELTTRYRPNFTTESHPKWPYINSGYVSCSKKNYDYGPLGKATYRTSSGGNSPIGVWTTDWTNYSKGKDDSNNKLSNYNPQRIFQIREPYSQKQAIVDSKDDTKLPQYYQKHINKWIGRTMLPSEAKNLLKSVAQVYLRYDTTTGEIYPMYTQDDYNLLSEEDKKQASYYVVPTGTNPDKRLSQKTDVEIEVTPNKRGIYVKIKYRPTTSFEVTAKDKSTGKELNKVLYDIDGNNGKTRYGAYSNYYTDSTTASNQSKRYGITDANGVATWSYWGENDPGASKLFNIESVLNYELYQNSPSYSKTQAPSCKGSSIAVHNHQYVDYQDIGKIQYNVLYDADGKIEGVIAYDPKDNNKILVDTTQGITCDYLEIDYDDYTVYPTYLYERKVKLKINKEDAGNKTKIPGVEFTIIKNPDSKDESQKKITTMQTDREGLDTVGTVISTIDTMSGKDEKIKYQIIEKPQTGYAKLDPINIWVYYNNNGNIYKIEYEDKNGNLEILAQIRTSTTITGGLTVTPYYAQEADLPKDVPILVNSVNTNIEDKKTHVDQDIEITIKNEAVFLSNITLKDQFYTNEVIPNVEFEITNNKGEKMLDPATLKNPITDANGQIPSLPIGKVYAGETVTYTIHQVTKAPGYYAKNSDIKLQITFDSQGKITGGITYLEGDDNQKHITIDGVTLRGLNVTIYNKPEDVILGIDKKDNTTGAQMGGVQFNITREEIDGVTSTTKTETYTTTDAGIIREKVDKFDTSKRVRYTVSEIAPPRGYRKIQDIVFEIRYNSDGKINVYNLVKQNNGVDGDGRQRVTVECIPINNRMYVLSNNQKVHMKVTIFNDDTYDLIIRDNDKDYGTQIAGTQYDVSINSMAKTVSSTNANGITRLNNNREVGNIGISISEVEAGTGYRNNLKNSIKFNVDKGAEIYTLSLDTSSIAANGYTLKSGPTAINDADYLNGYMYEIELDRGTSASTITSATIEIYESTGIIRVSFKNESKYMLNLTKIDSVDYTKVLEGAQFEITSQEIDDRGNTISAPETITIKETNDITNSEGKISIDLGKRPKNKIIKYTVKEIKPPADYNLIEEFHVIYKFNQYGLIDTSYTNTDTPKRANPEANPFFTNLLVKNGDLPNTYSIKVLLQDPNGYGINDAKFNITVRQPDPITGRPGNVIASKTGVALQRVNEPTQTITDSWGYTQEGVIVLDDIDYEGKMFIEVTQTMEGPGYVRGTNQTYGTVEATSVYNIPNIGDDPEVDLTITNNGGFKTNESVINTTTKDDEIKIYVQNNPSLQFKIHKISTATTDSSNGVEIPIPNVNFTLDEYGENGEVANTYTLPATDSEGNTFTNVDITNNCEKYVQYRIIEDTLNNYINLGDNAYVYVQYDKAGNIVYAMVTNTELLEVDESSYGTKELKLTIKNQPEVARKQYRVQIEAGYDYLQSTNSTLLGGATYSLSVEEEFGRPYYLFDDRTTIENEPLVYDDMNMRGYGLITVTAQLKSINGKKVTFNEGWVKVHINPDGTFDTSKNDNLGFDLRIDQPDPANGIDYYTIVLIDKIQLDESDLNLVIFKKDKDEDKEITDSPATITITQIVEDGPINTEDPDDGDDDPVTDTYTVTYDANGGTTAPEPETQTQDKDIQLNKTATWDVIEFIGWAENPDETIPDYKVGDWYTGREDITLYAVWDIDTEDDNEDEGDGEGETPEPAKQYVVNYNANGGTNAPEKQIKTEGEDLTLTSQTAKREGYLFIGWAEDKDATEAQYCLFDDEDSNIYTEDKDITLYAVWFKLDDTSYTEYAIEGGTVQTSGASGSALVSIPMPDEPGTYKFRLYENVAPTGYKGLENYATITITIDDIGGKLIVTKIESDNENLVPMALENKLQKFKLYNEIDVPEDEYRLNITKVDAAQTYTTADGTVKNVPLDEALFKIKLPDRYNTSVYAKSGENAIGTGHLDYCYIEQDKDYQVRLTKMARPSVQEVIDAGGKLTHTYEFQEVVPPDGYALINSLLTLTLELEVDYTDTENPYVRITSATSSDDSILRINHINTDGTLVDIDILNNPSNGDYTITYDANTLDPVTDVPAPQAKMAGVPITLSTQIPTRASYKFKEWNLLPDGTGVGFSAGYTPFTIDGNLTLYAIWEDAIYNIHYEANEPQDPATLAPYAVAIDMPLDQTKQPGIDITIDDDTLTPSIPGYETIYTFAGWNTSADGTGTHYNPGDIYNQDSDLTLYAQWTYQIRYHANEPVDPATTAPYAVAADIPANQTENVANTTDPIIDDTSIYPNMPTIPGYSYTFKEWNTSPEGTGTAYNPDDIYTSKTTIDLYAIWTYEIIYDENKPLDKFGLPESVTISNMPESPQVEITNPTVDSTIYTTTNLAPEVPEMTPDKYTFKEWNTQPDGSGDSYMPDDVYDKNVGVTLYAIWDDGRLYLKSKVDYYRITDAEVEETGLRMKVKYNTADHSKWLEGDKYLLGVIPSLGIRLVAADKQSDPVWDEQMGTTLERLKNNLDTNGEIKVYKDNGDDILDTTVDKEVKDTEYIGTGMFLNVTKGDEEINIRIIVRGDNSVTARIEGLINASDFNKAADYQKYRSSYTIIKEYEKLATDVNLDGQINTSDLNIIDNAISLGSKYVTYEYAIRVTLETDGGTLVAQNYIDVYENSKYKVNKQYAYINGKVLPIPVKEGYRFIGWYTEPTGGIEITSDTIVTDTSITTLYAQYEEI